MNKSRVCGEMSLFITRVCPNSFVNRPKKLECEFVFVVVRATVSYMILSLAEGQTLINFNGN